jgi:hypothetical protein
MIRIFVLFSAFLLLMPTIARGATITSERIGDHEMIFIEGEIAYEDLESFRKISLRPHKAIVVLNSDGGLYTLQLKLGKSLRSLGMLRQFLRLKFALPHVR